MTKSCSVDPQGDTSWAIMFLIDNSLAVTSKDAFWKNFRESNSIIYDGQLLHVSVQGN